jgi:hypothetical protein
VERVAPGDERGMEAFLEFMYKGSLDKDLLLQDILTVLKVFLLTGRVGLPYCMVQSHHSKLCLT